jgi:hypothetical protein
MPEIPLTELRSGDCIAWKGGSIPFHPLSEVLALFDLSWRTRVWHPWHVGYVVQVQDSEIVTQQAIGTGVHTITYGSAAELGDCKAYRWLKDPFPMAKQIEDFAEAHEREGYDFVGYLWNALGNLDMYLRHHPFRVVDDRYFCWELVSEFARAMGREIQREAEACNIEKMMIAWEK